LPGRVLPSDASEASGGLARQQHLESLPVDVVKAQSSADGLVTQGWLRVEGLEFHAVAQLPDESSATGQSVPSLPDVQPEEQAKDPLDMHVDDSLGQAR